jgi:hypothetical protein
MHNGQPSKGSPEKLLKEGGKNRPRLMSAQMQYPLTYPGKTNSGG